MKHIITFLCFVFALTISRAQISIRAKDTPKGKDVDVSIRTNPGSSKGSTDKGTSTKTTPTGNNGQPAPATDTASKPSGTSPFDESYAGPAKVSLKAFWRQLEKLRSGEYTLSNINNAERMLNEVKQKDPSYNIADLQAEVAGYRQKANNDAASQKAATGKAEAETMYFKDAWMKMVNIYSKGIDMGSGGSGKSYLDRVKAFNLEEYKEKRKAAGEQPSPNSYPNLIDAMLADYDNYVKRSDRLKWNVTEVMVKSRNEPNPQEKIALLNEAKYECEAVLIMSPDNAAFKQKLDEVNKLLGNAGAEAAKYYTSDFHKENVGKIVWSSKPLVIGKEKEMSAVIKNKFVTGEPIFGTAYLGNPAKQLMNGNERLRVIIKVDNGTAVWGGDLSYFILPLSSQDKSYIQFALLPDEDWFSKNYAPYVAKENWTYSYFMDQLVQAGDISHEITFSMEFPTNIQGDIDGSLSLDLSGGSTAIKALSTKLHDQLMASRTLPKAGMSNAALEQQMLAAANGLGWKDKFLKTVITSSSWAISKNELTGAILYRYVNAVCTLKDYEGKCYYQEFSFRQDYTGGGNYSGTVKYNSYGSKREIGCDKIK
ncbi:MAG: hypothetical protein JNM88_16760 [Chitinophagaceae bacterium]|nr:hypothetical protein [Chitinophagaceae bacterium]